jgi:hypothetical protein
MEYYTGILFLTTNRSGDIDEAFRSRIHLSLYYPKADKEMRTSIYNHFLDSFERMSYDVDLQGLRQHAEEVVEQELDGRQIRNVLATAHQLAENRKQRMDRSHVMQTLEAQKKQRPGRIIYVLTNGVWQDGPGVEEPIHKIKSMLHKNGQLDRKVGIQFVRFGEDPNGTARLSLLDSKANTRNRKYPKRHDRRQPAPLFPADSVSASSENGLRNEHYKSRRAPIKSSVRTPVRFNGNVEESEASISESDDSSDDEFSGSKA